VFQHFQVPRDRREADRERLGELGDGGIPIRETSQDGLVRDIPRSRAFETAFDAAICPGSSIGHLEIDGVREFLARVAEVDRAAAGVGAAGTVAAGTVPAGAVEFLAVGCQAGPSPPMSTSARLNRTGLSSWSYVQDSASRSGRHRTNCAVCRNRSPSM